MLDFLKKLKQFSISDSNKRRKTNIGTAKQNLAAAVQQRWRNQETGKMQKAA